MKSTTHKRTKALATYHSPWDQVTNITTYEQALTKAQEKCVDLGIVCYASGKVQIYVEHMYATDVFEEKEFTIWEAKTAADKTWANATKHFGDIYKKRRTLNKSQKAQRAGFESTNAMRTTASTTSKATSIDSSAQSVTDPTITNNQPNEWVKYSNSLEDSLTEAKTFAAAITTKSDTDCDQIIADLNEQQKQTMMALEKI